MDGGGGVRGTGRKVQDAAQHSQGVCVCVHACSCRDGKGPVRQGTIQPYSMQARCVRGALQPALRYPPAPRRAQRAASHTPPEHAGHTRAHTVIGLAEVCPHRVVVGKRIRRVIPNKVLAVADFESSSKATAEGGVAVVDASGCNQPNLRAKPRETHKDSGTRAASGVMAWGQCGEGWDGTRPAGPSLLPARLQCGHCRLPPPGGCITAFALCTVQRLRSPPSGGRDAGRYPALQADT